MAFDQNTLGIASWDFCLHWDVKKKIYFWGEKDGDSVGEVLLPSSCFSSQNLVFNNCLHTNRWDRWDQGVISHEPCFSSAAPMAEFLGCVSREFPFDAHHKHN